MNKFILCILFIFLLSSFVEKEKNEEFKKGSIFFVLSNDISINQSPDTIKASDKKGDKFTKTIVSDINDKEPNISPHSLDRSKLQADEIVSSKNIVENNIKSQSSQISGKSTIDDTLGRGLNADSNKKSGEPNHLRAISNTHSGSSVSKHQFNDQNYNESSNLFEIKKSIPFFYLIIVVLTIGLIIVLLLNQKLKRGLNIQAYNNLQLSGEIQRLRLTIKDIENSKKDTITEDNSIDQERKAQEFLFEVISKNRLSISEISTLTEHNQKRWVSVGYSAIGKMHLKSVPQIPCQDSHFVESLNKSWQLSIVCDGAGSAKYSHLGSDFFAKNAIPKKIKEELAKSEWYNKKLIPTEIQWREFIIKILESCYFDFKQWLQCQDLKEVVEKDFATTVIISVHNEKCVLVANIGDGRGGFLNDQGEFKPLFEPYKGSESNSTVFITSPIWGNVGEFIQTKVIRDNLISVFLLTDGMEKVSFNCSILVQKWIDPNLPYRNFFYPILLKMKNLTEAEEETLPEMWSKFIEEGNDLIKSEPDDKTMVISFLK